MDKEIGIFFHEKWNSTALCYNVDDPGGYYAKWNMSDTRETKYHFYKESKMIKLIKRE